MTFPFFLDKNASFFIMFLFFLPSARRMPNIFHGLRRKMREIFRKCAWRSLAVTCPRRSLTVTRVAAGSARPLAVTRVAASGCKWLIFPKSNTASLALGGHSSGCEWLQVADFPKIKYRAACVLNDKNEIMFGGQRIKWKQHDKHGSLISCDQKLAVDQLEEIKVDKQIKDSVPCSPVHHRCKRPTDPFLGN